jgi:predicted esterase
MRLTHAFAALVLSTCNSLWAADPSPAFSIPKLDNITIDGKSDEWNTKDGQAKGFCINVLGELAPHPLTDNTKSPTARIAWTDKGLAVLIQTFDATPNESANNATLHEGDSIELFISDPANPKQHFQVVIAPGGKTRVFVQDFRADKSQEIKVEAAVGNFIFAPVGGLYVPPAVEALLPFSALGIKPEIGAKLGLQIHVNDKIAAGQIAQYRWKPTHRGWRGNEYHNPLVLSDKPSEPVIYAVNADYQNFRRLRLRVNFDDGANIAIPGNTFSVADADGKILAKVPAFKGRDVIDLPFPEKPYGPLKISDASTSFTFTPDAPPSRLAGLDSVKTVFKPFAFSGANFPGVETDDPLLAEDILGKYKLSVRYFDAQLEEVNAAVLPGRYLALVHIESETYKVSDDRIYTLYRMPETIKSWRDIDFALKGVEFPKEFGVPGEVSNEQSQISADLFKDLIRNDLSKTPAAATMLAALAETKAGSGPMVWRTNPASLHGNFDYALRKKLNMITPYKYLEHLPPDYNDEKKKNEKFPLIIFLHGSGERGNKLELVKTTGFPQYLEAHKEFPAIVLSPQCPFGQQWRPQLVNDLVDEAIKKYRVDPDRIYMTGLSMGGYGTWAYAAWYPERLAAILPICGIGDAKDMARLKNIPTWAFHGDVDDQVPIGPDRAGVEALKAAGGNVQFTVYPGVGHDSWTQTYNNADIYKWMLSQKRTK